MTDQSNPVRVPGMLARIGEVIYWGCNLFIGAWIVGTAYEGTLYSVLSDIDALVTFATVGAVIWLFGRAALYVLAGR